MFDGHTLVSASRLLDLVSCLDRSLGMIFDRFEYATGMISNWAVVREAIRKETCELTLKNTSFVQQVGVCKFCAADNS